jgi:hypothetical protein
MVQIRQQISMVKLPGDGKKLRRFLKEDVYNLIYF